MGARWSARSRASSSNAAAEAVRALALVHAEFWNSPKLDALTWMPTAIDPIMLAAGAEYRRAWSRRSWSSSPATCPTAACALGQQVGASYEELATIGIRVDAPITVCHGDFRADNLMFDDSVTGRDHVGILDWQIAIRGPRHR